MSWSTLSKSTRPLELALPERRPGVAIRQWLYEEIRRAILDGRLGRGDRLPSTRALADSEGVSRGSAVTVYEQLTAEGYLTVRAGSGARVSERLPEDLLEAHRRAAPIENSAVRRTGPTPFVMQSRPFRPDEPALDEFPMEAWTRLAARRLRRFSVQALSSDELQGYRPLREAIADHLGASRGVRCHPDEVAITSGIQQGLDLLARILVRPGDKVWMEDPGYFGAVSAFRAAGAVIKPVPVDERGIRVDDGNRLAPDARAAHVTPSRQFGLCVAMSAERRLALLDWAVRAGAYVLEDDYDSEYRFSGRPAPALQGLDRHGRVIHLGTFNKTLFPSLRLGYLVLPASLIEPYVQMRFAVDRAPPSMSQAILADFIAEGRFSRHLRRMRQIYAERLGVLFEAGQQRLDSVLELSEVQAGLWTTGMLRNGMSSEQAETAARSAGVETVGLHRHCLERTDLAGLMLGFGAFRPNEIREGVEKLARALGS